MTHGIGPQARKFIPRPPAIASAAPTGSVDLLRAETVRGFDRRASRSAPLACPGLGGERSRGGVQHAMHPRKTDRPSAAGEDPALVEQVNDVADRHSFRVHQTHHRDNSLFTSVGHEAVAPYREPPAVRGFSEESLQLGSETHGRRGEIRTPPRRPQNLCDRTRIGLAQPTRSASKRGLDAAAPSAFLREGCAQVRAILLPAASPFEGRHERERLTESSLTSSKSTGWTRARVSFGRFVAWWSCPGWGLREDISMLTTKFHGAFSVAALLIAVLGVSGCKSQPLGGGSDRARRANDGRLVR